MDIKIENRDVVTDANGELLRIYGIDRMIQQVNLAAAVEKGSFAYDRELGSEIRGMDFTRENICKTLEGLINESLVRTGGVFVKVKSIQENDCGLCAVIMVSDGYIEEDTEVIINGQL